MSKSPATYSPEENQRGIVQRLNIEINDLNSDVFRLTAERTKYKDECGILRLTLSNIVQPVWWKKIDAASIFWSGILLSAFVVVMLSAVYASMWLTIAIGEL